MRNHDWIRFWHNSNLANPWQHCYKHVMINTNRLNEPELLVKTIFLIEQCRKPISNPQSSGLIIGIPRSWIMKIPNMCVYMCIYVYIYREREGVMYPRNFIVNKPWLCNYFSWYPPYGWFFKLYMMVKSISNSYSTRAFEIIFLVLHPRICPTYL